MAHQIVAIRPAREEDIEILAEFVIRLKQVNEELDPMYITRHDIREVAERYVKESLSDKNVILLVAETDGKVIGMVRAVIHERLFYEPRKEAIITDIYVHPSYRRRALASMLLDRLADELRERGVSLLVAEYPPGNKIAEKFFEKTGFKPILIRVYRYV